MKHKRAIVLGVAALAYLGLAALFFQGYRGYLKRPAPGAWDELNGLLLNPAVYKGEPVEFEPDWLRHYATDWGRLGGVKIRSSAGDAAVWWLVTDRTPDVDDFIVLEAHRFGTVDVLKLQAKSGQDGGG
jgi:hypothetical protein